MINFNVQDLAFNYVEIDESEKESAVRFIWNCTAVAKIGDIVAKTQTADNGVSLSQS